MLKVPTPSANLNFEERAPCNRALSLPLLFLPQESGRDAFARAEKLLLQDAHPILQILLRARNTVHEVES
jgi:hypothetical protein